MSRPFIFSKVESKRFKLRTFRSHLDKINKSDFLKTISDKRIDIAIVRIPADQQQIIEDIRSLNIPLIVADTLVYYYSDLEIYSPNPLKYKDLEFIEFTPDLFDTMDLLVTEIFSTYKNHYHANPLLKINLTEAYKEWARSYASDHNKGRLGWVVRKDQKYVGFILCALDSKTCEIILNGVIPSSSGKGIYSDMIRFAQKYFKRKDFSLLKVSTQVYNYAAQKVWNREGFFMKEAFFTIHLNCLMNATQMGKHEFDFMITGDDTYQYARLITEAICINEKMEHRGKKWNNKVEEAFINHIIIQVLRHTVPNCGNVTISQSSRFFSPLFENNKYLFEITYPFMDKGIKKVLVKIKNCQSDIIFLSYIDIIEEFSCNDML